MNVIGRLNETLKDVAKSFTVEPLARDLQPVVNETLSKHGKDRQRKSPLSPLLTVWLVLSLALRRDLSYFNVLDWLLSGLRALGWDLPRHPLSEGAITHARKRIGVDVFKDLFKASVGIACKVPPLFHGLVSLSVDGTQMTLPDTPQNALRFGKPGVSRGVAAFPQIRVVGLVASALQTIQDMAFGPCWGKGTGERTLAMELILSNARSGLLFLLDRGFFGFDLLHAILTRGAHFLIRVPKSAKLTPIRDSRRADGSYLAWLEGKVEDAAGPHKNGRKRWKKVQHLVRVIRYQIAGFRSSRLVTSLLDTTIEAVELVHEYHRRWEIELTYDSIKTHQSGTRTGQCATIFRSKLPELVEQELYAMLTVYNLVRGVISEAAKKHGLDPRSISFVDSLQAILDAIPGMRGAPLQRLPFLYQQLLDDIARCKLKRWRRPRVFARVVKVKMSKFKLKTFKDHEIRRDYSGETRVLGATG
jgi:hypothetical protein